MLDFRHPLLQVHAHRPWPLPQRPWALQQRWDRLLFAHWRVAPAAVQRLLPQGLQVDLFAGAAYVAVVPFVLQIRARWAPPLPTAYRFPEINVRTYVTDGCTPGVWFFSLDAASRLAVFGARRLFHLPYFHAAIDFEARGERAEYHARRSDGRAVFRAAYGPRGEAFRPTPGSLEHFLTERYCLYAAGPRETLWRGDVHHRPWTLRPAWAEIRENSMAEAAGLVLEGDPLLHDAESLQVIAWPLSRAPGVESHLDRGPAARVPTYCPDGA